MDFSIILLIAFLAYTAFLFAIAWFTSRKADNESFFVGNRKSNWMLVAYGMIGASLSGVTFMSIPGNVSKENFYYVPMLLGFIIGYMVIAFVLLPLYYRLNLTSIYSYLRDRFGVYSYKSGALFFILSRALGATIRTFLVVYVLHSFVLGPMGIPFGLAATIFIALAILYTFYGGIKTIIWTDSFQTTFMILGALVAAVVLSQRLGFGMGDMLGAVYSSDYSNMFDTDVHAGTFWAKRFFAGIFIAIAMTGLDQSMMQKNLSCKNIWEAQKNIITSTTLMIVVNMLFLTLGALLAIYVVKEGVEIPLDKLGRPETDKIFPIIAFEHLGTFAGLCFFIGLISAAYPSCANALTSITTSVCIDLVELDQRPAWSDQKKKQVRMYAQIATTLVFLALIIMFYYVKNDAIIIMVFQIATYTYGPLLGMFLFGIFTKIKVHDPAVPFICVCAPALCFVYENYLSGYTGFKFGFSLLLVNAALVMLGLLAASRGKDALKNQAAYKPEA